MAWNTMETAPKDGRWFLLLRTITIAHTAKPFRACPELVMLRRVRSSPESAGYWQNAWGHFVADDNARGLWAEVDALPLRQEYERKEADRLRQGGQPMPLPEPFDSPALADTGGGNGR